jgi:predicted nuclease of predicted toxin-antitoxin system
VKLLLDENLPPSLAQEIQTAFPGSGHVLGLGLGGRSDREIFQFAGKGGFAILTKDDDFEALSVQYGAPPKIVLLKVGNLLLRDLHSLVASKLPDVHEFLNGGTDAQVLKIGRP